MEIKHPTPAERHDYRIIAIAFTAKKDNSDEHITLLMRNLTRRTYGNQTLTLFGGPMYREFKSAFARCKKADEAKAEAEKTVRKDVDLFPHADLVISDKAALLEYFTEDNNIDDLTYFDGGFITVVFDKPMYVVWRNDMDKVCIGKGADGRPLIGKAKKGDKVYTSTGEAKTASSYSEFVFYMSHEGETLQSVSPFSEVERSIQARFIPTETPIAVIADTSDEDAADDGLL